MSWAKANANHLNNHISQTTVGCMLDWLIGLLSWLTSWLVACLIDLFAWLTLSAWIPLMDLLILRFGDFFWDPRGFHICSSWFQGDYLWARWFRVRRHRGLSTRPSGAGQGGSTTGTGPATVGEIRNGTDGIVCLLRFGGGFKYTCYFYTRLGRWYNLTSIFFSNGLKPPTSSGLVMSMWLLYMVLCAKLRWHKIIGL